MVSGGTSLVAAVLGTATGAFLESYWLHGSPVSLAGAAAALVVAAVVPFVLVRSVDRRRARAETTRLRGENRSRYEAHAEELNQRAFRPLREVRLESSPPGPEGRSPTTLGLGVPDGPLTRPLESLPFWKFAVQHLSTEPALAGAWARASESATAYRRLQLEIVSDLSSRFEHRVLSEYGFDVQLGGSPSDTTTWCDVRALAWLAVSRPDGLAPGELTVVTPLEAVSESRSAAPVPHIVAVSGARLLVSRVAGEANPHRLHSVFTSVVRTDAVVRRRAALRIAERTAVDECQRLADGMRTFSDRVVIEGTFSGTCDGCRGWTPR